MSNDVLYHILRTHDRVDKFRFEINLCKEFPDNHNPVLVSIGSQLFDKRYLSEKQVRYAMVLLEKEGIVI